MFALHIISAINGLVVGVCHFQAFWVGSKFTRSKFLRFLKPKNKRKKPEKIGKNRTKEISVEISFRSPPISDISAEISEILFPGYK